MGKFSFLCNFVNSAHTDMYDNLKKAVLKGFSLFSYTLELRAIYGDVMTLKHKKADFFLCN